MDINGAAIMAAQLDRGGAVQSPGRDGLLAWRSALGVGRGARRWPRDASLPAVS